MMAVGRISGPLLKDNLLRNGVNLAFETSLLYLDVKNGRVGVNTATPLYQLDVNGTTQTTSIEAANQAAIASFTLTGNTISSTSTTINFVPSGANGVVYQGRATIGTQLAMTGNVISTVGTNVDLIINTTGTGQTKFNGNVLVNGDLHATGSITADGSLTLGDANTDNITFGGEINSDIVPDINNTYSLGSVGKQWLNVYAQNGNIVNANATTLNTTTARTSALDFTGSTISTINTNTDINLISTGSGGTQIGNVRFSDNKITNIVAGAVTTIEQVTPATTWTGTVAQGVPLTFDGLIAGTTLFVSTAPTGGTPTPGPTPGLIRKTYAGYPFFSGGTVTDAITWFNAQTNPTDQVTLTSFSFSGAYVSGNYTTGPQASSSWEFSGYFVPPVSGVYTISAVGDDYAFAIVNGVNPPSQNNPTVVTLTAGIPYPLRVLYTNTIGNGNLAIQWKNDSTQPSYTGNWSGVIVTTAISAGAIVPGQLLTGPGVQAGTYIVSNISGTGTSTTSQWTVNNSQSVASTVITATPIILTASSVTGTISYKMVVTGGVSAGTYITAFGNGTGGAGTYYVTLTSLVASPTAMTGTPLGGYVKFTGTNGVVIPIGTVGARPSQSETEQGMIRYNTELNLVEMWTGSAWFSVAGSAAGVTADVATDIGIATALIIG
jgi:hypothetical protein